MKKEEKNKKRILGFIFLFVAAVTLVGLTVSYFSDFISGSGTATAGSLDLVAGTTTFTRYYTQGGVEASDTGSTIDNLNPGDIIVINSSVTNAGNKSAYLRTAITVTTGNNYAATFKAPTGVLEIYPTTETNSAIRAGTATPLTVVTSTKTNTNDTLSYTDAGTAILNGTGGTEKETETGGLDGPVTLQYKIYFRSDAGNDYQKLAVTFGFKVEALQYRNNTTPTWSSVTSTEFAL